MQIQIEKTLDVEVVERQLAELWKQAAHEMPDEEAVMRARVANLLVFVRSESALAEVEAMLRELTSVHPCRVLLMHGDSEAEDRDIELSVESFFHSEKRASNSARRLCCEEIILRAQGRFVTELPSAALPLLVSDLSTFIWWRTALQVGDKILHNLLNASDRLIIDSAEFASPRRDLAETNKLFNEDIAGVGVSDLNWARLTSWRGLLADFFDVPAFQASLDQIDSVRIEYVGPASAPHDVAPQALLLAGWLASRLKWQLDNKQRQENEATTSFTFKSRGADGDAVQDGGSSPTVSEGFTDRTIRVELKRVEQGDRKPGRLAAVELKTGGEDGASFNVSRSADNLHLVTEARVGANVHRGRVLPVRNRSAAHLLSREMEILCNDQIYQEAVAAAAKLLENLG